MGAKYEGRYGVGKEASCWMRLSLLWSGVRVSKQCKAEGAAKMLSVEQIVSLHVIMVDIHDQFKKDCHLKLRVGSTKSILYTIKISIPSDCTRNPHQK